MDNNKIEKLIQRIRNRIGYGFTKTEIVTELSKEYAMEDIFLAYHAAQILDKG